MTHLGMLNALHLSFLSSSIRALHSVGGPMLGLMLCSSGLEILNTFVFESVF